MTFIDIGAKMLDTLIPPHDAEPSAHYWWRVRIAIIACSSFLGLCGFVWIAYGGANPFIPGFATEASEATVSAKVSWLYEDALSNKIDELQIQKCSATDGLRGRLSQDLTAALRRYQDETGRVYPLQPCPD